MADSERMEVVGDRSRLVESETGVQLHPVSGQWHRHGQTPQLGVARGSVGRLIIGMPEPPRKGSAVD